MSAKRWLSVVIATLAILVQIDASFVLYKGRDLEAFASERGVSTACMKAL
jgi:hypothetical protein